MALITPRCPICHKQMKNDLVLDPGFFKTVQYIIDTICRGGVPPKPKFGCCGMVDNPKYAEWKKEQNKLSTKLKTAALNTAGMEAKNQNPPPKKIPCPNNLKKKAVGKYNDRIVSRRPRGPLFDIAGKKIVKMF